MIDKPTSIRMSPKTKRQMKIIAAEQDMSVGAMYARLADYLQALSPQIRRKVFFPNDKRI